MPPTGSPLNIKDVGGVTVASFRDRILLDTNEIMLIEGELVDLIAGQEDLKLIIDFERVQAISSQMLGALLTVNDHMKDTDCRLALCNLHQKIQEAFEVTSLKDLFTIYPNQAAAVAAIRKD